MTQQGDTGRCKHCGKPIMFVDGVGWTHTGGGAEGLKCLLCGWTGSNVGGLQSCPSCGSNKELINDHQAGT